MSVLGVCFRGQTPPPDVERDPFSLPLQIPDAVKTIQAALLAATVFVRILRARIKRKKQ